MAGEGILCDHCCTYDAYNSVIPGDLSFPFQNFFYKDLNCRIHDNSRTVPVRDMKENNCRLKSSFVKTCLM